MVVQSSLWQVEHQSSEFSELCSALYERELGVISQAPFSSVVQIQGRIKSLPYYVKSTAHAMFNSQTPLTLDIQNASWSAKQAVKTPIENQLANYHTSVLKWYQSTELLRGLVVPIAIDGTIVLDSIDRVDVDKHRFRTNVYGWFDLKAEIKTIEKPLLVKPTKPIMMAACSGHCWKNQRKANPIIPTLRELLLSCAINWRNFKQPI